MEEFTSINKLRNRVKVFKPFKSSLKNAFELKFLHNRYIKNIN